MAEWLRAQDFTTIASIMSVVIAFSLTRTVLIVLGWLKGPILQNFEHYGDDERFFHVLPNLLGWSGGAIIVTNYWSLRLWNINYGLWGMGVLMVIGAVVALYYPQYTWQANGLFMNYPRWLHEIGERTTRFERRRIAYMWLRLPFRLRLIYNGNDQAFLEWADMIIISTLL